MEVEIDSMLPLDEGHEEKSTCTATVKRKRRKLSPGDASSMKCVVCGSSAFGYNFDVISCESCKAFFRRNAQKAANRLSHCVRDGACAINSNSRKHCPACRMKKCLESGMRKELITPIEKLVNRANYRGKRSDRKARLKIEDTSDLKSVTSDDASCTKSRSESADIDLNNDMQCNSSQAGCGSSDEMSTPHQSLNFLEIKHSPTSSNGCGVSNSEPQPPPNIPEKPSPLPPAILKSLPPELVSKVKSCFDNRSSSVDDREIAHQCAMLICGRTHPEQETKPESPNYEPESFMRAMHTSPHRDISFEDRILKFMNPVDAIRLIQPYPLPPGRTSLIRNEIFLEYFTNVKSGLMNIAKPLKKDEIMKTNLSEMPTTLEGSFNHMENMIRRVIAVLKCLPQFLALTRELQICLLKRSIHGLFAFCGALAYDSSRNAFRIVYEEENGEIQTFYLDFETYVTQGLKDIRSTSWESFTGKDKADELIQVNKIVFNQITSFTQNDRILIISLLCTRFFNQTDNLFDMNLNDGMQWLLKRTSAELLLFVREYLARKSPDADAEHQYHMVVSLFDAIKPLEQAGEMLSHVVRLDGLNPLMREFLTFSKFAKVNGGRPHLPNHSGSS